MIDGFKILLLEDEPCVYEMLIAFFSNPRRCGFDASIEHFTKLSDAIDAIEHNKYDVIVSDLLLPDSDGSCTITSIHSVAWDTPIIALSGLVGNGDRLSLLEQGACDFFLKPCSIKALARKILDTVTYTRSSEIMRLKRLREYRAQKAREALYIIGSGQNAYT